MRCVTERIHGNGLETGATAIELEFQRDIDSIGKIPAVPTILDVVCRSTGMGFAAIARVTDERWIACQVLDTIDFGMKPGGELRVETTICQEVKDSSKAVVINHVAEDTAYCNHPTPAMYGFQSYISMPIFLSGGRFFGTLCAIDPRPARVNTPEIIGMFKLFAELIAFHLEANEKLIVSENSLLDERKTAELREQFIAVLGHDLRNPLAAIVAGTRMLSRVELDTKSAHILMLMQGSAQRMVGLVDNVMDFARGRMGGGLSLRPQAMPLEPTLMQVISEIRTTFPERQIETSFNLGSPLRADHARLAQLFSNLLGNAVIHGAANTTIRVEAKADEKGFALMVTNTGAAISPEALKRLFQPFSRSHSAAESKGLGLGLFIASEIAKAHGGRLDVASSERETRFTFSMPAPAETA